MRCYFENSLKNLMYYYVDEVYGRRVSMKRKNGDLLQLRLAMYHVVNRGK
jgi:hypothetical protein